MTLNCCAVKHRVRRHIDFIAPDRGPNNFFYGPALQSVLEADAGGVNQGFHASRSPCLLLLIQPRESVFHLGRKWNDRDALGVWSEVRDRDIQQVLGRSADFHRTAFWG